MLYQDLFHAFEEGRLHLPEGEVQFADIPWSPHATFEGVALKHIVTGAETDGRFSCHLVRIAPDHSIGSHLHGEQLEMHEVVAGGGTCRNNGVLLPYSPGSISLFTPGQLHEVHAGADGLYFFAKFMPALL